LAVVASDVPNTRSDAYNTTESAVVELPSLGGFITSSSSAAVTQSYLLPCANTRGAASADFDMVTSTDCLLHAVPTDEDDEEMAADEQIEDWDHEVFDP